jgi:hypothetical protein
VVELLVVRHALVELRVPVQQGEERGRAPHRERLDTQGAGSAAAGEEFEADP